MDNAKRHAEFLSDNLKNTLIEKKPSVLRDKKSREFIQIKKGVQLLRKEIVLAYSKAKVMYIKLERKDKEAMFHSDKSLARERPSCSISSKLQQHEVA